MTKSDTHAPAPQLTPLPQDVIDLVIAAREVAYSDPEPATLRALDKAVEAFAERVPWDDDPESLATSEGSVASIVPSNCSGYSFVFEPGVLHVRKDGSGYIAVNEGDFVLEDDRCEGEDGPEGSVHWIARMDASEITALRDFLNGAPSPAPQKAAQTLERKTALLKIMHAACVNTRARPLSLRGPWVICDDDLDDAIASSERLLAVYDGNSAPAAHVSPGWEGEEKLTAEEAWTILCETPDITSPAEYPDHALITMEQLASFMARAMPTPAPQMIGPTRGPWKIYQDGIHPVLDDGSSVNDGYAICQFFGPDGFANAQLTMAAPDLLDATREAIRFFEGSGTPQTCLAQLRAAYKKAGGLAHVDR